MEGKTEQGGQGRENRAGKTVEGGQGREAREERTGQGKQERKDRAGRTGHSQSFMLCNRNSHKYLRLWQYCIHQLPTPPTL